MSHPVLSPEEIDALMEGFDTSPKTGPRVDKGAPLSIPQLSNHPLSALDAIHEQFAARLAVHLSEQCGRHVNVVSRPAVEMTRWRFLSERVPMHVAFQASMARDSGRVLAILDEAGVRRYADFLFGGDGSDVSGHAAGLSPVEQSVARGLMLAVFQMYAHATGRALAPDLVSTTLGPDGEGIGCATTGTRMVNAEFVVSDGSMAICLVVATPVLTEAGRTDVDRAGRPVKHGDHAWMNQTSGNLAATCSQTAVMAKKGSTRPGKPLIRTALRGERVGTASDSGRVHKLAWSGRAQ